MMRLVQVLLTAAILVSLSVSLPIYFFAYRTPPPSSGNTSAEPVVYVWDQPNYEGTFGGGIDHATVIPIPTIPNGTQVVYVQGELAPVSWVLLTHGLFNRSGECANSFSPVDACTLYFGIWTPSAWASYVNGGPGTPIWCFPGTTGTCLGLDGGQVATPNLSTSVGTGWEIVLWNFETYDLSGSYQFTVYASAHPR